MKNTKRTLFTSLMALILCFSMLIGTTFAWFTDSATSAGNLIQSGKLDIALDYWDGDSWETIEGANSLFTNNLWEPGHTEVVYLKLSNLGSLALKYQLAISVLSETEGTNMAGDPFKLSDYIQMGVVEGVNGETGAYADREAAVNAVKANSGIIGAGYAKQGNMLANAAELYMAVVVYMPENVGNEANAKTGTDAPIINLGVKVLATQHTAEGDSFGDQYDKEAWVSGMAVYTAEDLQAAINAGETSIKLMDDITLDSSIVIPASSTTFSMRSATPATVIDLDGKTITGTVGRDADGNRVHVIVNNGNAVIKNGVITSAGVNGGSAIYNADGATLTVENVTLNGAPQEGSTWPSYTVNNYGTLTVSDSSIYGVQGIIATNNTANTTVNNVIAYRDGWSSGHVFYNSSTAKVTINGGTYTNDGNGVDGTMIYGGETVVNGGTFIVKEGAYFALCSGSKLTVNGGDFSNIKSCIAWGGAMTISGGTFGFNPTTYVADGFKAVENNGKYVVVSDSVDGVVGTPAELEDALTNAGAAGSGDTEIVLNGDIDLTGKTWTPIEVDGYHGAGVVTIDGQGATIYGLTAPLFAGGFAGNSGIVIKNLTIADSDIVGSTQGGGAFIDCADSMQVVTLENCHLVNSTVSGGRVGGLLGWVSGYSNENDGPVKTYVTIKSCSVVDSKVIGDGSAAAIAGHPGASDYTYTTIEDCKIENVDVISYEPISSWRTGAIVGTANNGHVVINNVSVEDVTLTQDGVTADKTHLYGRFVPGTTGTLVIDGAFVVLNADGLATAVANGQTNILLADGEYDMPNFGEGKANGVTFTGASREGVVIKLYNTPSGGDFCLANSTATLENMTIVTEIKDWAGFQNAQKLTFNKCNFVNNLFLSGNAIFNECHFEVTTNHYNVWAYSANSRTYTAEFNKCVFDCAGKSIYIDGNAGGTTTMKFTECTFNDNDGGATDKAAIETGTTYGAGATYNVVITDCEFNGFAVNPNGANTNSTIWANKNSMPADKLNITIDGVEIY